MTRRTARILTHVLALTVLAAVATGVITSPDVDLIRLIIRIVSTTAAIGLLIVTAWSSHDDVSGGDGGLGGAGAPGDPGGPGGIGGTGGAGRPGGIGGKGGDGGSGQPGPPGAAGGAGGRGGDSPRGTT